MRKQTVLMLSNGEATFFCTRKELAERLISNGLEVYLSAPKEEYYKQILEMGIHRIITKMDRHGLNPLKDFLLFFRYIIMIFRIKPDIILSYTIKPNLYGSLAARLSHTPCISNITGIGEAFQKKTVLRTFISWALKYATQKNKCLFFQNQDNMKIYKELGILGKQQILIPGSGVNLLTHPFQPISDELKTIRFLMLGRICRSKGVFEYLQASNRILKKYKNVECYLVGANDDNSCYKQVLKECPQTFRFHLLSEQNASDIVYFLSQIHCLVHPSYHEGMSNVIMEAAATGRAAIASDIYGCKEIIDDGITGFLVKPKDSDALFEAMEKFCNMPIEEIKSMGIRARNKVEKEFDRSIVIQKYLSVIYSELQCSYR